jgi:hypothetical protein
MPAPLADRAAKKKNPVPAKWQEQGQHATGKLRREKRAANLQAICLPGPSRFARTNRSADAHRISICLQAGLLTLDADSVAFPFRLI